VRGIGRARRDDPALGVVHPVEELNQHLGWADDVVSCLPLTDATRALFDHAAFAAMRTGATFVNVGRGPVVVEADLVAALASGQVGAAGLDVFEDEPLPADHPLWELGNVVVSPHMSGDEVGWEAALTRQFARNLERWRTGEQLVNVVHGGRSEGHP
jgi:phosphoglycerate dehydrogenase-like enzyme